MNARLPSIAPRQLRPLLLLSLALLAAASVHAQKSETDALGRPKIPEVKGTLPSPIDPKRPLSVDEMRAKKRDDLIKDVYHGAKHAAEALASLDDANPAKRSSAQGRLEYGQEVLQVGLRLADARKTEDATAFFADAEKALEKAAQSFEKAETKGQAEALYALAQVRAECLGKKIQAYRDLVAALEVEPTHAGALAAKARLEARYPDIKNAKLPSESK